LARERCIAMNDDRQHLVTDCIAHQVHLEREPRDRENERVYGIWK
jgi:hypothetical protein